MIVQWQLIAALATTVLGGAPENTGKARSPLRGGTVITGAVGVVDFIASAGSTGASCTGSMIAPDVLLTAAHCFDLLGAANASTGTARLDIFYHSPEAGRRRVFRGTATWRVLPGYDGWNGVSAPGEANDDVAIVRIPGTFRKTSYADYLRVYAADGGSLRRKLHFHGAGIHTYSGKSDNKLRWSMFEVESVGDHHLVVDNRKRVTLCQGDSGGPFTYTTKAGSVSVPLIAGVLSGSERWDDDVCASNDAPRDDSFAARPHPVRLDALGVQCTTLSGAGKKYRRCFDLPFIEDVPYEGRDRDDAVAIAVGAVL